jgi:F-type H+-transporting ATPase subunit b
MDRFPSFLTVGLVASAALLAAAPALASEGGLRIFPQLPALPILLALFVALIFPVNALLLRPLLRVLDERLQRIEGARERAENLSAQAEETLGRYRHAIEAARNEADEERKGVVEAARGAQSQLVSEARTEAEREQERARAEVEQASEQARASLRRDAELLAREAAQRILGRDLS